MPKRRIEQKVFPRFKSSPRRPTFIRQWRKHRTLTLEKLAARVDMSVGNLSMIERGEYGYSQDTLEALADALQCEPADLLMRNPLDLEAPWSIWESLKPNQRKQAIRLLRALREDEVA
jgi:transcriptional regulator with XRE-family HTH domain